ncbi:MAG TPA: protein-glutamate O-methyltransferase CheR [Cytophagaceae bacterium]
MREITPSEIHDLLESVYLRLGYDFRDYSLAHLKRRLTNRMVLSHIDTPEELKYKVLNDPAFTTLLLKDLSIQVTEMFRDPGFYISFRELVVPILKTYSFFKIWHAGCATGEEVYSMAILLKEENLYDRCMVYATDFNQHAVDQGREGVYPDDKIKEYTKNYQSAGGKASLSDYFIHNYNNILFNTELRKNIVWANHNLVTDSVFAEVNVVLCRNVMIYFNKDLQNKVHGLFYESLVNGGILCLGLKESLQFTNVHDKYLALDKKHKIYKKRYTLS